MFHRILVPLDGSPLGEYALPYALTIGRKSRADVHVAQVHVPDAYNDYDYAHSDELEAEAKSREVQYLDGLRRKMTKAFDGPLHIHHLEGLVPETLASEVVDQGIDLVVMNAHGWGYVSRSIMGSVSDYLMRHLTVPLLVMHSQQPTARLDRDLSFGRILICLDGSPLAETILGSVSSLAQLWHSQCHLLRVVAPPDHLGEPRDEQQMTLCKHACDKATGDARAYLETVANRFRGEIPGVKTNVVLSRQVAKAILHEAHRIECDLIAIATHGRGGVSRLVLGNVADKVVRGAETAVLVFHPAP